MEKNYYFFRVILNNLENNEAKDIIKSLFKRLNSDMEKKIFSGKEFFISGTNNNVGNLIYEKLKDKIDIRKIEFISDNLNQIGVTIFPLPEREDIYDVIHIFSDKKFENTSSVEVINMLDGFKAEKLILKHPKICISCSSETPDKLNFCIHCGYEFITKESLKTYSLKITQIDSTSNRLKLAKYMSEYTSIKDYQKMATYLTRLPTIFNFSMYPSEANDFFSLLDEFNAIYYLLDTELFSFEKFFSSFISYGSLNIGTIKADKNYLDPVISKLAVETIKDSTSDVLKKITTKCLFEIYRIAELIKNSESNSKILLTDIEKDIINLLGKFLYFIKRAEHLNIYFSEHSVDKINREIEILKEKIAKSENKTATEMYKEAILLKENEFNDLISLSNTIEILQSQIVSVMTILSTMRTKITYLSSLDIHKDKLNSKIKGDFTELNNLKSNLQNKLKSIEEILLI